MHIHSASCSHANASRRLDPTRTVMLRRKYEADMVRRFQQLKADIKDFLVEQDKLSLKTNAPFEFTRSADKITKFMRWLQSQQRKGILELKRGTRLGDNTWQDIYIQSAYQKGLASAGNNLKQQGVDVKQSYFDAGFFRPQHADRAGIIFTRAFSDLKGITDAMDTRISRALAQGIIDGRGVQSIARDINDAVDSVGIVRARTLARTEIINAHAEASLQTYKDAGLEGVTVQAEFTTAGDDKVCPECDSLAGTVVPIDEASGVIPVHPNCRCAWLPVVPDPEGMVLA